MSKLRDTIREVKSKEEVYLKERQHKQYDITNLDVKIEKLLEDKRKLISQKYQLKEDFYG